MVARVRIGAVFCSSQHGLVDELLACQVSVGVTAPESVILGRDLGTEQVIDQLMRLGDVAAIPWDRPELVEKHLGALRGGIA